MSESASSVELSNQATAAANQLLRIDQLTVHINTPHGVVQALRGIDLQLRAGEALALVGESGSGKSITALSISGLLPESAAMVGGDIFFAQQRVNEFDQRAWNKLRGSRIGMVFQNPMSSFNPSMRVGDQIAEVLRAHRDLSKTAARLRSVQLLERMRIADAAARAHQYPFEFSGGMLQRAMIAMAVACEPQLLIADEPTTALDVTVQAEVLDLLRELRRDSGMALLLITHDLGIVAQIADRVAVMYAGQIIEQGPVGALLHAPAHPYTAALQAAAPTIAQDFLQAIPGTPPDLTNPPSGCGFYARCKHAMRICMDGAVPNFELNAQHASRCWLLHPQCKNSEPSVDV
ncbi:MAG: peptide transporter ATP-binding protein [Verrucomicrobiaceae bacterium]|nr:peptide transporter ATP-binding protein [Verrucomicrobiaceae bacterium]